MTRFSGAPLSKIVRFQTQAPCPAHVAAFAIANVRPHVAHHAEFDAAAIVDSAGRDSFVAWQRFCDALRP